MKENSQFNTILSSLEAKGVEIDQTGIMQKREDNALKTVFIKIISVVGGLIAMGTFLGFISLAFARDSNFDILFLSFGLLSMIGCYFIHKSTDNAVRDGVGIALYISGFVLLLAALIQHDFIPTNMYIATIVIASISLFLYKNQIITFIAATAIIIGCHGLLFENFSNDYLSLLLLVLLLSVVFLFYKETFLRSTSLWWNNNYQAILVATFCYCLGLSIMTSVEMFLPYYGSERMLFSYSTKVVFILITLGSLYILLDRALIQNTVIKGMSIVIMAVFLYLLGIDYPAFIVGFLFALWSYNNQFKTGIVLSICTFIWAMGMYYYDLSISLLAKSISLMLSGIIFLSVYWVIHKNWKQDEQE